MPKGRYIDTVDEQQRSVFTTFRVYRSATGYKSFDSFADALEYATTNGGARIDQIDTTILWVVDPD